MINYTVCKEIVTPESAEYGDIEDSWIEGEESVDFRYMVELLEGCEASDSHPTEHSWYTTMYQDPYTAEIEITNYHPLTPRDGRYMLKAWKVSR